MVDPVPDYCPFCGARLRDDGLDDHLDRHDDCARRFSAWRDGAEDGSTVADGAGLSGGVLKAATLAIIVGVVLAYSLLITQQLLLGIVASAITVLAFVVTGW